jgi:hypothetical protein
MMAQTNYTVTTQNGMVRIDLGDGAIVGFMPDQATKLAGLLLMGAHEAVHNNRPPSLTYTFNFED